MSRIVITFKNNEKEKKIEKFLESKLSASAYIKELVWSELNKTDSNRSVNLEELTLDDFDDKKQDLDDPADGFNFDLD